MATVTHGLKDGVDQILEMTRALERMLDGRKTSASDDDKRLIIEKCLVEVARLRDQATITRGAIENVLRSSRDH